MRIFKLFNTSFCMLSIYLIGLLIWGYLYLDNPVAESDLATVWINAAFFLIIFATFFSARKCLVIGDEIRDALLKSEQRIINNQVNYNPEYLASIMKEEAFFGNARLDAAFNLYKSDMSSMAKYSAEAEIDIERYINYELIETSINTLFLNQITGTMTGLGILGTFWGLSLGLNQFNLSGNADTMIKEIQPLMSGIKVAFHTSIYGIIYSLLFNFFYRERLLEYSNAVSCFINTYQKLVVPASNNGNEGSLIKNQNKIKKCLDNQIESNEKD